ncbi:MAG: hypothetical protein A3G81_00280 [Betaproteobacteria bacterium RIFCSPLOWO2_12_FULL_65_14]|nr:MAG: hypothetical protein A3G81_00280 [Betaproteobacteria bacterium RIFCSPLOWO2_12_FULL_65_14]
MGSVVSYANNSRQCFCQIKFESGERVLISIAGPPNAGVKIMKLLLGLIPTQTVWECTAAMAGDFDSYVHRLHLMFPEVKHPLDSIRDRLLACRSIPEARDSLLKVQRTVSP